MSRCIGKLRTPTKARNMQVVLEEVAVAPGSKRVEEGEEEEEVRRG